MDVLLGPVVGVRRGSRRSGSRRIPGCRATTATSAAP